MLAHVKINKFRERFLQFYKAKESEAESPNDA